MATYVIRRILAMIPALLGIALITFILMHATRGGPFTSEHSNPETTAALEQAYHLDESLWPTFYGSGAGVWQTLVAGLGLVAVAAGVALLWLRRRSATAAAAQLPDADGPRPHPVPDHRAISPSADLRGRAPPLLVGDYVLPGPAQPAGRERPDPGQFLRFLWNMLHGDLGPSFSQKGRGVTEIIVPAAVNSFVLGVSAFALLICMALPLGIVAALRQNTWVDYVATTFSLIGYSIPNFVLGLVLILAIGLKLRLAADLGLGWAGIPDHARLRAGDPPDGRADPADPGQYAGGACTRTTSAPPGRRASAGGSS